MLDLQIRWDESIGLFYLDPDKKGHTLDNFGKKNLHAIPDSVSYLLYAAQTERLQEIDIQAILKNIKNCQFHDGERRGQIKWFLEDQDKSDTNAPFFICVGLIPLKKYFALALGKSNLSLLDDILAETRYYFLHKVRLGGCYYPNSYMGDLLFAWLLNEIYGDKTAEKELQRYLKYSAKYWLDKHWGWGEHLSDGYAKVCCFELSMFLLMAIKLPDQIRTLYTRALQQLLDIEDLYGGKPRVPTIRSYAFETSPKQTTFRSSIRPWKRDEKVLISNLPPIAPLLHKLGWQNLLTAAIPAPSEIKIPCFNRNFASAYILPDFRLGAMNRFPIMESTSYLPWQCFPVAFLHDQGDWGFLQWNSEEDGSCFSHPCHSKDYDIDRGLSRKVRPPICGRTFSIRQKNQLLVLRHMPSLSMAWNRFADRLRIVNPSATFTEKQLSPNCSTIDFQWPTGRTLSIARISFSDTPKHRPVIQKNNFLDWELEYQEFPNMNETASLWAFAIDETINTVPKLDFATMRYRPFDPECRPFTLKWQIGKQFWHLQVDPARQIFRSR